MTTDDRKRDLIEKARVAFCDAWEAKRKEIGRGIAEPGTKTRAGIEAAFAVFEAAQKPTDDEVEALARVVKRCIDDSYTFEGELDAAVDRALVGAILAAGFRRPVSPGENREEQGNG